MNETPLRALRLAIRLNAVAFVLFWTMAFVILVFGIDLGPVLTALIRWGAHGDAYAMMLCSLYVPWGVFLWKAADDPGSHAMFIDFTVVANAAHYTLMLFQAQLMPGQHAHLLGDVLWGWLGLLPLMVTWYPYRARLAKLDLKNRQVSEPAR